MSKYFYNENYFKQIDTEEKAYWLGFLYADGCITRFYRNEKLKSMSLELTLQEEDKEHLQKFLAALQSNVPIQNKTIGGKYKANRVVINCTSMCRDLINLGCTPQKSLILEFPSEDILPKSFINSFIRGYFDGDGGVFYKEYEIYDKKQDKKYLSYSYTCYFSGTKQMLKTISQILSENNIKTSEVKKDNRNNVYGLRIHNPENIQNFAKYIYNNSTVNLSRKFDKFFFIASNNNLKINAS